MPLDPGRTRLRRCAARGEGGGHRDRPCEHRVPCGYREAYGCFLQWLGLVSTHTRGLQTPSRRMYASAPPDGHLMYAPGGPATSSSGRDT